MPSSLPGNKSIVKTLKVLDAFGFERQRLGVAELARQTGLPRASLYRILNPLLEAGYLSQDPADGRYGLGLRLFELGHVVQAGMSLAGVLPRHLDQLAARLPYTLLVGLLHADRLVYIDKRESPEGLKVGSQVGRVRPPNYGLLGKVLLAFMPVEESARLLAAHPPELWEGRRGVDPVSIPPRLAEIRGQGYAVAVDETAPGVAGVGVPIFDWRGDRAAAALAVLAPTVQFSPQERRRCLELAQEFSRQVSRRLGCRLPL
ncbi:MAG: IclR family transcriptional regulator [Thermodesulfobacteriota bacterium]